MPILVQWKWMERPPSFLVIFHFYDDYSKPNLRTEKKRFLLDKPFYIYIPEELVPLPLRPPFDESSNTRTVVTWAPSHSELGLLMDLLSYANIVNGFKEQVKRELRKKLVILDTDTEHDVKLLEGRIEDFRKTVRDKVHALGGHKDNKTGEFEFDFYAELCPEYIDYLKEILKPYL